MEMSALILLHVFFGIVWAGGAVAAGLFIVPSVVEAGPAGGAVMAGVLERRFPVLMTVSALLVLLSGIRLYMIRFSVPFLQTPEGIVLTLGAIFGIGAFLLGATIQGPTAQRMGKIAAAVAASGGPPSPEQAAELGALRARLAKVGKITAWHLVAASLLMASHRLAAFM